MSTLDYAATEQALRDGVVAAVSQRAVVIVEGPDARSYLQGQVSQDLLPLAVGEATEALLLSPQGKLDAYVRVGVLADDRLLVDAEADYGELLLGRLARFKLRVKATLELASWPMVALRGPGAKALAPPGLHGAGIAIAISWPGFTGVDVLAPDAKFADVALGDPSALEVARIEAGMPRMGAELTEKTIAAEAGLVERTVSFTKGCYTGQELVARLDARGSRVPFRLHGFSADAPPDQRVEPGDQLLFDERGVGEVTSVAYSPTRHGLVGLAYLRREVKAPADLVLASGEEHLAVHVDELPR